MTDTITVNGKKYKLVDEEEGENVKEAVKEAKKAAKEEASEGGSQEDAKEAAETAAKEEGISAESAKMIAVAVVTELKEGGYLEEGGEEGDNKDDKEGGKETEKEGGEEKLEDADTKPESTHKWYR